MLEWIKTILEGATITDGKLDVAATMAAIQKEFPANAVPKADFNAKLDELKSANKTIEDLKKNNTDNEALQAKIKEHEATIKTLQTDAENTRKSYALKDALAKEGVLDPDYLIYKAGGINKFTFSKEGEPVGIAEAVKPYKADSSMAHLFKQAGGYNPAAGGTPAGVNPFAKESWNMTEQGKLLRENPEQARQLASAAGFKL